MRGAGIVFMRRPIADVALDNDESRHVVRACEYLNRLSDPLAVVGITDALDIPAIGQKARGDVVTEGEIRMPFDRHAIAVVYPAEIPEHQMARERRGFARDAL